MLDNNKNVWFESQNVFNEKKLQRKYKKGSPLRHGMF